MSFKKYEIVGKNLPHIPWEERPEKQRDVLWRCKNNPVIPRDLIPGSNSIFNSAVVPYKEGYAGVFRCDDKNRYMRIHRGLSKDGIHWHIDTNPIQFLWHENNKPITLEYAYDPRVCFIEDRYYITWCNGLNGQPTIGVAYTFDFEKFFQLENAFLPYNRNGVLFPRKINNSFAMLSRPSDTGHTPFGDIYFSSSPDMTHWGKHRFVMGKLKEGWQSTKIGAGPVPIETSEGWLLIYHGVLTSCNGFVYSMGAALLDLDEPWKTLYRTGPYILSPQEYYECVGDVPNVVFPCASLVDAGTGRLAIYYGGADTVTCLAFSYIDDLIDYIKNNSVPVTNK
ncbi:MAG TPA: glycoside hydrolase family 130 protein [bacterium]|nr:glycoside hydrolase family 130 protein [bacterium]HPN43533.1 glycoside hydrolase family 130 protein [bacterium]